MRKVACAVLILTLTIFLINPLSSDARGRGQGGGEDHWDEGYWWVPLTTVIGGVVVIWAVAVWARHHEYYDTSPPVVIREQPPVHFQPSPSIQPSTAERLFIYPRKGQSQELQAKDTYECNSWAVGQTKYDPTQPPADISESQAFQKHADYNRAMTTCLDARGYTAK